MTHPMRPTAEQLTEWLSAALTVHPDGRPAVIAGHVAYQAYAAGADAELEACHVLLQTGFPGSLREARRPAPPTPQQLALEALERNSLFIAAEDVDLIRQGLEANDG